MCAVFTELLCLLPARDGGHRDMLCVLQDDVHRVQPVMDAVPDVQEALLRHLYPTGFYDTVRLGMSMSIHRSCAASAS